MCLNCDSGKYSPSSGFTSCLDCQNGEYIETTGNFACKQCLSGVTSQNKTLCWSNDCVSGTMAIFNLYDITCSICLEGTYSDTSSSTTCKLCEKGTYNSNIGGTKCEMCDAGKYSPSIGSSTCLDCPNGEYIETKGNNFACKLCPSGVTDINKTLCYENKCEAGYRTVVKANSIECELCPNGTFNSQAKNSVCSFCFAGTFSGKKGSTNCTKCPPGTFSAFDGSPICLPCSRDTYTSVSGASICAPCNGIVTSSNKNCTVNMCPAQGTKAVPDTNNIRCEHCPPGTFSIAQSSSCTKCASGTFSTMYGSSECLPCKIAGTLCVDGGIIVERGWWVHVTSTGELQSYSCPEKICQGTPVNQMYSNDSSIVCGPNRLQENGNVLCGKCSPGYIEDGSECIICEKSKAGMIFLLVIGVVGYVGFIHYSSQMSSEKATMSIFMYFIQTALLMLSPVSTYLSWISFLNFNPKQAADGSCIMPLTPYQSLALNFSIPVVFFSILFIFAVIEWLYKTKYKKYYFSLTSYKKTLISLLLFSYSQFTTLCLQFLNCTSVDGYSSYMYNIPQIDCRSNKYMSYYPIVGFLFISNTFAVPSLLWYLVWQKRNNLEHEGESYISPLFKPFERRVYFWQSWILSRRVIIVAISTYLINNGPMRSFATTMYNLGCLVLQMWKKPFLRHIDDLMETTSLILLVLLSAVQAYSPPPTDNITNKILALSIILSYSVVFCLYVLAEKRLKKKTK